MSRISIRFAKPYDAKRFEADGVVSGPLPAGESSSERVAKWRIEEAAGRRAILVAQETSGLFGMVHVIFQFPPGYRDAEAANGQDIAMIESLSTRIRVPAGVSDALMNDAQIVAKRQRVKTLTLCLPLADDRAILQAKSWMFAFFRKPL